MATVTIQLIEGLERGLILRELETPVSIGREDDNAVRLNDERVSRFHAKIQESEGKLILTDLDSTNGTRVNGHPVQMRVLQVGDQLAIGRCLLVFGSEEEIAQRHIDLQEHSHTSADSSDLTIGSVGSFPMHSDDGDLNDSVGELFPEGPPPPPSDLSPAQRAELSDVIAYAHEQLREMIHGTISEEGNAAGVMRVDWSSWQRLLNLEMGLAKYMKQIADPDA